MQPYFVTVTKPSDEWILTGDGAIMDDEPENDLNIGESVIINQSGEGDSEMWSNIQGTPTEGDIINIVWTGGDSDIVVSTIEL